MDSLTTGGSVCRAAAHDAGIRFAARDVFLDNVQENTYITGQIHKLVEIALASGRRWASATRTRPP